MFMFLGDVAHLSRCVDVVTEKASSISSRSEAKIHYMKYIDLAKNIDILRSWANHLRDLSIDELESSGYRVIQLCNMRENLDNTLKHIETAITILDSVHEDAKMDLRQSLSLGNELSGAGRVLRYLIGYLPITHRAKDSLENSLFKQDDANRPIRTLYSVCVKTLTLMAELDAEVGENGKLKTWGKWRDSRRGDKSGRDSDSERDVKLYKTNSHSSTLQIIRHRQTYLRTRRRYVYVRTAKHARCIAV